jgi:hypothetical protein
MVKGILGDADIEGQVMALVRRMENETWRGLWQPLNLAVETFAGLGLPKNTPDAVIWRLCQQRELVLITANRNQDSPDSLEATLRAGNTLSSLPVVTLSDIRAVYHSHDYAERAVEKLLGYLLDIDRYRGAGRLYIP